MPKGPEQIHLEQRNALLVVLSFEKMVILEAFLLFDALVVIVPKNGHKIRLRHTYLDRPLPYSIIFT
jgi:hypothetical protein